MQFKTYRRNIQYYFMEGVVMKSKKSCHEHCPACGSECITYLTVLKEIRKKITTYCDEVCEKMISDCDEDCICRAIFNLLEATEGVR